MDLGRRTIVSKEGLSLQDGGIGTRSNGCVICIRQIQELVALRGVPRIVPLHLRTQNLMLTAHLMSAEKGKDVSGCI